MTETLVPREELLDVAQRLRRVQAELDRILLGRPALHRLVLCGVLARGHLLLEGVPGVGKTALIKALGGILDLSFGRVQFTPDLMPGDILGTHVLEERAAGGREMVFRPGPVFTNLLLADEINRASPKTQSALLEAMQESAVTLLGTTRPLPSPFFVLASQNPIELEGTYPLPEAQLDRFLFKLDVPPAGPGELEEIVSTRRRGEPPKPELVLTRADLDAAFAVMDRIVMPRPVARFVARIVAATHPGAAEAPGEVTQYVQYGASPRGAIAISEAARAHALLAGRPTAGFEDVKAVAPAVLGHRVLLGYRARFDRVDVRGLVVRLLSGLPEVELALPRGVEVEPA